MSLKAFFCHSSSDSEFVIEVASHVKKNIDYVFLYEEYQTAKNDFISTINHNLEICNLMIIFAQECELSFYQESEINAAIKKRKENKDYQIFIVKHRNTSLNESFNLVKGFPILEYDKTNSVQALSIATNILRFLDIHYTDDGLPLNPQLFSYEKEIINHFMTKIAIERKINNKEDLNEEEILLLSQIKLKTFDGCPVKWKGVKHASGIIENPPYIQETIGKFRDPTARITVDGRSFYLKEENPNIICFSCKTKEKLFFPEAGPRQILFHPRFSNELRVAILVSGGIAPGINSVIDGITQRHRFYASIDENKHQLKVYGLKNGFLAFDDFTDSQILLAHENYPPDEQIRPQIKTTEKANEGGSILGTSRVDYLINGENRVEEISEIIHCLRNALIDILYIIGGDGSMRAAHAIYNIAKREQEVNPGLRDLSIVAIPKTMDNDILWMWQSFGFISAVEKAREVIEHLATEVKSNPRLCIVQLFGSHSGFIVSHAVLAGRLGCCDAALIPEENFSIKGLAKHMINKMREGRNHPYGLIVMSETAIPTDAINFIDNSLPSFIDAGLTVEEKNAIINFNNLKANNIGFQGQTNDELRNAGLKIVKEGLKYWLNPMNNPELKRHPEIRWDKLRVFTNEPRHLLRAIPPSTLDIINGNRLGTLAVDNAIAGYTDFMISQWLTEFVLVPLQLVVLGRKQIPTSGIFWKSVIAKTNQHDLNKSL